MKKKAFHATKSKYLNYFFYLTYLVLPSVTTTLFQWFICTNVDPENEDTDEYDRYLTADMSISCQSGYYKQWTVYVILMMLLYPVGIPALYLYLLYCNKEEIMNRDKEEEATEPAEGLQHETQHRQSALDAKERSSSIAIAKTVGVDDDDLVKEVDEELGRRKQMSFSYASGQSRESSAVRESENTVVGEGQEGSKLSDSAQRLSFLWQAYEPQYWYWEVIETTRKLVLTAVLSVCAPGSSEQSVLGVLLSYVYIRIYSYYRPYEEDADDVLAETGQVQILMTFFVTLVITNNLLSSKWDYGLGFLLTLINLGIIFLTFYYEIDNYRATVKEAKEKEEKIRQQREQKRAQKRLEFAYKAGGLAPPTDGRGSSMSGVAPAPAIQFKKMNAKELQELDDKKLKQMIGKDAVDSDDEDGDEATTNVLHQSATKNTMLNRPLPSNKQISGDIELQAFRPKPKPVIIARNEVDSDDE
jgi:hypothetical protein